MPSVSEQKPLQRPDWWPSRPWALSLLVAWFVLQAVLTVALEVLFTTWNVHGDKTQNLILAAKCAQLLAAGFISARAWGEFSQFCGLGDIHRLKGSILPMTFYTAFLVGAILIYRKVVVAGMLEIPNEQLDFAGKQNHSVLAALLVLASLSEELVFRGLWLGALLSRFNSTVAVALTVVVFWLGHVLGRGFGNSPTDSFMILLATLDIPFAAWAWADLQLRCGSIYACIISHCSVNLILLYLF